MPRANSACRLEVIDTKSKQKHKKATGPPPRLSSTTTVSKTAMPEIHNMILPIET